MIRVIGRALGVSLTVLASHVIHAQPLRRAGAAPEATRLMVSAFMVRDSLSRLVARQCADELATLLRKSSVRVISPTALESGVSEIDIWGPANEDDMRALMKQLRLDAVVELHVTRSESGVVVQLLRFRRDGQPLDSGKVVSTAVTQMMPHAIALLIAGDTSLVRRTP